MNDSDFYEMVKKAQSMINNNQVPPDVMKMAQNMGNNLNNSDNKSQADNMSSGSASNDTNKGSNNTDSNNSGMPDFSKMDMQTLMKMQSIFSKLNSASDDDMSRLLFALKPYLRNEKKEKIDDYIKLARMGKMTELFDLLGRK